MRNSEVRHSLYHAVTLLVLLLCTSAVGASPKVIWSYVPGGELSGAPAYTRDGRVLFAAEDRRLYAVDADGTLRWRYDLRQRPLTGPSVARDGVVYIGLQPNRIVAITPAGRLRWSAVGNGPPLAVVAAPGGVVYAAYAGGEVSARTAHGGLLWRRELPYRLTVAPVLNASGELVVVGADGRLSALDRGGASVWSYRHDRDITALIALAGGELRLGDGAGSVLAISRGGALMRRVSPLSQPIVALHADSSGALLLVAADGALARTSAADAVRWTARPPGVGVSAAVVSGDGTAYAVTADGRLLVLDKEARLLADQTGARGNPYAHVAMSPGGRLLVAGRDWVVDLVAPHQRAADADFDALGQWSNLRGDAGATAVASGYRGPDVADYRDLPDFIYLNELVRSNLATDRARALREIERRVADLRVGGSYAYLIELMLQLATTPRVFPGGPHLAGLEEQRVRALRILAHLGDTDAVARLARLLAAEPSSSSRAALMAALGGIESDPDGDATAAIAASMRREDVSSAEGLAAVGALYAIARFNLQPAREAAIAALVWIFGQARLASSVRESARDHLRLIE